MCDTRAARGRPTIHLDAKGYAERALFAAFGDLPQLRPDEIEGDMEQVPEELCQLIAQTHWSDLPAWLVEPYSSLIFQFSPKAYQFLIAGQALTALRSGRRNATDALILSLDFGDPLDAFCAEYREILTRDQLTSLIKILRALREKWDDDQLRTQIDATVMQLLR